MRLKIAGLEKDDNMTADCAQKRLQKRRVLGTWSQAPSCSRQKKALAGTSGPESYCKRQPRLSSPCSGPHKHRPCHHQVAKCRQRGGAPPPTSQPPSPPQELTVIRASRVSNFSVVPCSRLNSFSANPCSRVRRQCARLGSSA
jgi:hypothetical protein